MHLPAIPSNTTDDDRPVVEIYTMTCRTTECGGQGPWLSDAAETTDAHGSDWHLDHAASTGHREFWRWQLSRSRARVR